MKKIVALLLIMSFILASVPAMAVDTKYRSTLMNASVLLPGTLSVISELPSREGDSINMDNINIYYSIQGSDLIILATLTYVPDYVGHTLKDLPKEEIEGWKEIFNASYPKHSKSVTLKPSYSSNQRIYRYYGMNKKGEDGIWMLSYTGVYDGLYVCVCCESHDRYGYRGAEMRAIFDAFNASFQLFAMDRGVTFSPFDPNDYEVEIFNLLYDDSPNSIFRSY